MDHVAEDASVPVDLLEVDFLDEREAQFVANDLTADQGLAHCMQNLLCSFLPQHAPNCRLRLGSECEELKLAAQTAHNMLHLGEPEFATI
jgi:hypothetical protein